MPGPDHFFTSWQECGECAKRGFPQNRSVPPGTLNVLSNLTRTSPKAVVMA